jgi:hypothetical protein
MVFTEDRNTTINFSHKSCSIEYYEDAKVIYIRFKSDREIDLFKDMITTRYADVFEIEVVYHTAIVKFSDTVTITNITIVNKQPYISISLNYTCFLTRLNYSYLS